MTATRLVILLSIALVLSGCGKPTIGKVGGLRLVYGIEAGQQFDQPAMIRAAEQRLRSGGFRHATASIQAGDQLVIELPGKISSADTTRAKALLAAAGRLELRIVADPTKDSDLIARATESPEDADAEPPKADHVWVGFDPERVPLENWMVLRDSRSGGKQILMLVSEDDILATDLSEVQTGLDEALRPCVMGKVTAAGSAKMKTLTTYNLQRRLGIVFDDTLVSAPTIQSAISDSFQLTGRFTQEEVDLMVGVLKSGAFPARITREPLVEEVVSPR